jgi:ADP-ribose pyrophosphatase YjhB (NUDIX family)
MTETPLTETEAAFTRLGYKYCPQCRTDMVDKYLFGRTRRVCPNPDCRFVQFIDPKVTTSVMVIDRNKVLLMKRRVSPGKGDWCFPGGFMEMGETPQLSAARECKEETGFDIEITQLLDVLSYEDYRGGGVIIMYLGRIIGGEAALDPAEAEAIGLFGPDELPENIAFESNINALNAWRAGRV